MFCCGARALPRPPPSTAHALVTGGCSGIGFALAEGLARAGWPLLLVSDQSIRLEAAAATLALAHGVSVRPVVVDLARPDAVAQLLRAVEALPGPPPEVEVLCANAGFFFFGEAVDADAARAAAMLQLHVITTSLLCQYFCRAMRTRRRGWVLVTASISAWLAAPGISYYASSKAFQRAFVASLRCELRVWGVNVTLLAPGATATALYDATERVDVPKARRWGVMVDPDFVAREGLRALFDGRAVAIPGALAKVMCCCMAVTPQWIMDCLRSCTSFLPHPDRQVR